jgi:tetratricopeptide (TPR) repeat protein
MALEDIERLREKVDKDPNSKLFIPLAEEYKKAGMYDEAIDVLIKGIERQPGYMSAHVSLGKIYIERDMLKEAKAEFEQVVGAIPDNLYAHKKLAEIYRDLGETDKAVEEFKMVLELNPTDEWAAINLADIKGEPKPHLEAQESTIEEEETILAESEVLSEIEEEKPEVPVSEEIKEGVEETRDVSQPTLSPSDADQYILQGKYMEAMNIYRNLLSIEPDNMQVMQRIEELKTLLKLLGKDKEELIVKLDNLLAGIKKRRDEFFESQEG